MHPICILESGLIRGIPDFNPGRLRTGPSRLTVLEDRFELKYIGAILRIEGEAMLRLV